MFRSLSRFLPIKISNRSSHVKSAIWEDPSKWESTQIPGRGGNWEEMTLGIHSPPSNSTYVSISPDKISMQVWGDKVHISTSPDRIKMQAWGDARIIFRKLRMQGAISDMSKKERESQIKDIVIKPDTMLNDSSE